MSKIFLDKDNNVVYEGYETHEIVANPTLAGTEGNLTGLKIGDTKYKVSQGGSSNHLYNYCITFELSDDPGNDYIIYVLSSEQFESFDDGETPTITYNDFFNLLYEKLQVWCSGSPNDIYNVDTTNKTYGISGASTYGESDTTLKQLSGRQIF